MRISHGTIYGIVPQGLVLFNDDDHQRLVDYMTYLRYLLMAIGCWRFPCETTTVLMFLEKLTMTTHFLYENNFQIYTKIGSLILFDKRW